MASELHILSSTAAASLSLADANFDGVKHHNPDDVSSKDKTLSFLVSAVAVCGVLAALLAMCLELSINVILAFAIPLATGPWIIVQRYKIQWLPAFREEANELRFKVNDLAMQRNRLANEKNRMQRQIKRMTPLQERFVYLVKREGQDVDEYKDIVKENTKVRTRIQKIEASSKMLDHFKAILTPQSSGKKFISEKDLDEFVSLARQLLERRKIINEDVLRGAFKASLSATTTTWFDRTTSMTENEKKEAHRAKEKEANDTNTFIVVELPLEAPPELPRAPREPPQERQQEPTQEPSPESSQEPPQEPPAPHLSSEVEDYVWEKLHKTRSESSGPKLNPFTTSISQLSDKNKKNKEKAIMENTIAEDALLDQLLKSFSYASSRKEDTSQADQRSYLQEEEDDPADQEMAIFMTNL